jgi:hypothetical protein
MLGMPYPNPSDPELKERMAHLDKQAAAAASAAAAPNTTAPQLQEQLQEQQTPQQPEQQQPAASSRQVSAFQVVNTGRSLTTDATRSSHAKQQQQQQQQQQPTAPATTAPSTATADPAGAAGGIAAPGQLSIGQQQQQQQQPLEQQTQRQVKQQQQQWLLTGRDYYDDLCFKAVNQCVGRVVRHQGDYAALVMVDSRWVAGPAQFAAASQQQQGGRQLPVQKLPGWVQRSYVPTAGEFGQAYKLLAQFFARQRQVKE